MARYGQIRSRFSVYLENILESPIFFRQLENAGFGGVKFMVKLTMATGCFPAAAFSRLGCTSEDRSAEARETATKLVDASWCKLL